MVRFLLLVVAFAFCESGWAAKATVDRTVIQEGDTFQLTIQSEQGEPDLSPLEALFDVMSRSKSSQMSFINGKVTSRTDWIVTLMPKQRGRLVIPSIRVGREMTSPITVEVSTTSAQNRNANAQDVMIEVSAKPLNPYVQAQVVYTEKFFHAIDIQDGSLSQPKLDNVVVERIGDDVRYQTQRGGRNYQVIERRYALFPQHSGSIEIPPAVFSGNAIQHRGNFNLDPFNRFFSQGVLKPIRLSSESVKLNVRARPAQFSGNDWMPSEQVQLKQTWSTQPEKFKVGEPITRTLRLEAKGLTAAQIPAFSVTSDGKFNVYPDQPVVETKTDGDGLLGVREEKFAIVPTRPGPLVLPAINVKWWNTRTDKLETATIPAQTFNVVGGSLAQRGQVPMVDDQNLPLSDSAHDPVVVGGASQSGYWPWLTAFFALAWIITLIGWQYSRVRKSKKNVAPGNEVPQRETEVLRELKSCSLKNDLTGVRNALMSWSAIRWPNEQPLTLDRLPELLNAPHLADSINEMNRAKFSATPKSWDGTAFWDSIAHHVQSTSVKSRTHKPVLAPLYP